MGDVVALGNRSDCPSPQMGHLAQCLNLVMYKMSLHRLLTLALLSAFIANWKTLLSAALALWWFAHALHNSTGRPVRDTAISNVETKQVGLLWLRTASLRKD